jgi:hypothetical protein
MAYYIDLVVFGLPLLLCLHGWVRSYQDPMARERRRNQSMRAGLYRYLAFTGADFLIVASLGLYAAWRAKLWWLWAAFAVFMFSLGAIALVVAACSHYDKMPPPEIPPFDPQLTERVLVRRRKRLRTQACFLVLWGYSWHHLFIGSGS